MLGDVVRRYNFLPGMVLAAALLGASAFDDALRTRNTDRSAPRGLGLIWAAAVVLWSGYLLVTNRFAGGLGSAVYPAVALTLLLAGVAVVRFSRQQATTWASVAILLLVVSDYQAFGTNRRFNAVDGIVERNWKGDRRVGGAGLRGMDQEVYDEMLRHPEYRVGLFEGPSVTDLRYYGLNSPQGFDPFIAKEYKAAIETFVSFKTNRLFDIDPLHEKMLRYFGIRYVVARNNTPMQAKLDDDARFRKLLPGTSFFVVFEYLNAQPAWRLNNGQASVTRWDPEHRSFDVNADREGEFVLVEQFFPGWRATVDGRDTEMHRAEMTFQGVSVPAGRHRVEFRYAPISLYAGAGISAVGWLGMLLVLRGRRTKRTNSRALNTAPIDSHRQKALTAVPDKPFGLAYGCAGWHCHGYSGGSKLSELTPQTFRANISGGSRL
jgi:hypothetical protein